MMGLTKREAEIKRLILVGLHTTGVAPSHDELKDSLGLSSKSGVNRIINALVDRGHVRRIPHIARGLEVIGDRSISAPTAADMTKMDPAELGRWIALACGLLAHKIGVSKLRETLDRIGARLAGAR
jgi:SOS-response transcriptional repressor LexA